MGDVTKSYTIGDDVISQTTTAEGTQYLLYDGHGSTRQLTDSAGAVLDSYSYDAYGVMLGTDDTAAANADTSLLYAGEQYDSGLSQYYLRARYYDPLTGRFNRIDPFAGNNHDPQSLHKYLYAHCNPVNNIDPTGNFTLTRLITAIMISAVLVNIGVTVYSGIRHNIGTGAIAWQVVQNIAAFMAILGVFACSGLVAIAAGGVLAISCIVGFINLVRSWPEMDTTDKVIAFVTVLTFLAFAGAARAAAIPKAPPHGAFRPGGCSLSPASFWRHSCLCSVYGSSM